VAGVERGLVHSRFTQRDICKSLSDLVITGAGNWLGVDEVDRRPIRLLVQLAALVVVEVNITPSAELTDGFRQKDTAVAKVTRHGDLQQVGSGANPAHAYPGETTTVKNSLSWFHKRWGWPDVQYIPVVEMREIIFSIEVA
jgi:hypothetical protein